MSVQIWITSDWHRKHENIYKFTYEDKFGVEHRVREKFKDATEGDAYIEAKWRELVRPEDHIYHLGDLTMFRGKHQVNEFIHLFKSLPGHKRLILGNHDAYDVKTYIEAGFQKIKASNVIDNMLLTHYPVHPDSISQRFLGNIHGHTHAQPDIGPRYLNVSVERTDYAPITLEEAKAKLKVKQGK